MDEDDWSEDDWDIEQVINFIRKGYDINIEEQNYDNDSDVWIEICEKGYYVDSYDYANGDYDKNKYLRIPECDFEDLIKGLVERIKGD